MRPEVALVSSCTPFDVAQSRPRSGEENACVTALFDSRVDAARRLAGALDAYRGRNPLVLAIPRGAVEMGAVIAEALGGELDVVLVRKLRAPAASVEHVRAYADQVVCLQTPREFLAVGQFYRQFPQVEDAEVVALLERRSLKREVPLSH